MALATSASITVWTSTSLASATWAIDWPSSRAVRSSSSVMPMASAAVARLSPRCSRDPRAGASAGGLGGVLGAVLGTGEVGGPEQRTGSSPAREGE